jgi:hypothetical protein
VRREQAVRVLEALDVAGLPFLRVELLEGVCEVAEPRVVGSGWVPSYGRTGDPVAWFYARGCGRTGIVTLAVAARANPVPPPTVFTTGARFLAPHPAAAPTDTR